jgi:hypothetical protein
MPPTTDAFSTGTVLSYWHRLRVRLDVARNDDEDVAEVTAEDRWPSRHTYASTTKRAASPAMSLFSLAIPSALQGIAFNAIQLLRGAFGVTRPIAGVPVLTCPKAEIELFSQNEVTA